MKLPKIEVKRNKDGGNPRLFIDGRKVKFDHSLDGCRSKYIDPKKRFIVKVESERADDHFGTLHHDEKSFHKKLLKFHKPYFPKLLKSSKKGRWSVHEYIHLKEYTPSKKHQKIVNQIVNKYGINDVNASWCRNWALNVKTKLPCIFDGAYVYNN